MIETQGRYGEAEPLYVRALETRERVLGKDHPKTLTGLDNLARLYREQGRYGEAEPLYVRALEARERVLGKDHPQTLTSANSLARLYREQGRYGEAEPLFVRALEARERVLGKDHPEILISVNNLALLYHNEGRHEEAEPLYVHALKTRERVLGKDHPDTLTSVNNLAGLYYSQGRFGEAEPLFVRALEARERMSGKDHPETLISVNNLAELYRAQGRYEEAEPLYVRALETSERVLSKDHPDTLISVNNLAALYQLQGRPKEAEPLYARALKTSEQVLGKDHPYTLRSVNNLAVLYSSQSRLGEAEPLFVRVLETSERVLGKDHPSTLVSLNNLAEIYQAQGRLKEAESLYVRAYKTNERVLGKDHPGTLNTQLNLAFSLINTRHIDKALRELRLVDERLRHFVGAQLTTTLKERVRRRWLVSESKFQDAVFSLALQHPQPDTLSLAAEVLLRWKRLAGAAEALIARLARSSRDVQVMEIADELGEERARLSRLVNLPDPDKDAIVSAREEVERMEVALAQLSREFQAYLAGRAVDWEQVQTSLPNGSALLALRAFHPMDFASRYTAEKHWLALVISADPGGAPELVLKDLGPAAPMAEAHRTLRETGSEEASRELYRLLFGELDAQLAGFERLYIAPDGMLDLVAFARLVVPDGRYWIERQDLHQVSVGRDLVNSTSAAVASGGMVVFGGVDYSGFPASEEIPPTKAESPTAADELLAMNRGLRRERGEFAKLRFTGHEAEAVAQYYWDPQDR
jgi:tetratricopeptide (TPR) repeat protein